MSRYARNLGLLVSGVLAFSATSETAFAADTLITDGQSVGQQSIGGGDTISIDLGATVSVTGAGQSAVVSAVNNTTITVLNSGHIGSTGGGNSNGILSRGGSVISGVNDGTIHGTDDAIDASIIRDFTNNGTLSGNWGVLGTTVETFINNGQIRAVTGDGVWATTIVSMINNGTISTGDDGVVATGTLHQLINNGVINGVDEGVDADYGTVINRGHIVGGRRGIEFDRGTAGNSSVTNSGVVRSGAGPSGVAIDFQGAGDDSLTVSGRSIIVGGINFGAGSDTLTFLPGHGSVLTFDTVPEVVNSSNGPVFTSGTQIAVLNTTPLTLFNDTIANLSESIGGLVSEQANQSNARFLADRLAPRQQRKNQLASANADAVTFPETRRYNSWLEGFGGRNERDGEGSLLGATTRFYGAAAGGDTQLTQHSNFGIFLGHSFTDIEVDFGSNDLEVETIFGGIYAGVSHFGYSVDSSITAGFSSYDETRQFANNTVADGIEKARSDYSGYFLNPQLTVSRPVRVRPGIFLVPSLRVGYTGLFLDGYQETGTLANVTYGKRDIHLLQSRGQLTLAISDELNKAGAPRAGHWNLGVFGGIENRASLGKNKVDATLLDQTISFDPGGDDLVTRGFAGLSAQYELSDLLTLSGNVEAGVGNDQSFYTTARVRAAYRF